MQTTVYGNRRLLLVGTGPVTKILGEAAKRALEAGKVQAILSFITIKQSYTLKAVRVNNRFQTSNL